MTRVITQGFSVPAERFDPLPMYGRNQSFETIRWQELYWQYDARQRKFYKNFTGRTHASIWADECYPPTLMTGPDNAMKQALAADPRSWSMPHIDTETGYLGEPNAFNNFLQMHLNYRPTNPYTKRDEVPADVDEIYIAPRVTYDQCQMRIAMNLPAPTEVAGLYYFCGFELNSQGGNTIMALMYDGGNNRYVLVAIHPAHFGFNYGFGSASYADVLPITINNPGDWADYYFIWDGPVLRFIQPQAGQTNPMVYPDMTETSFPGVPATASVQPFIANESTVATAAKEWLVGTWVIAPLFTQANAWQTNKRSGAISACSCWEVIFDTGGRGHILIYVEGTGTADTYEIYWTGAGADQLANFPEVRTWRRIDDNDWNGVLDANGIASIGLFNAARFIKVILKRDDWANTLRTLETIAFTANRT